MRSRIVGALRVEEKCFMLAGRRVSHVDGRSFLTSLTSSTFWTVPGGFVPVTAFHMTPIGALFVEQFQAFPTVQWVVLGMDGSGVYGCGARLTGVDDRVG